MVSTLSIQTLITLPPIQAEPSRDWKAVLKDEKVLAGFLRKRRLINFGAFGVVYRIEDAAIKIGCISDTEADIQQWVCDQFGRALPVWASALNVPLPRVVTREVCPRHGFPSELWTPTSICCHCGEPMGVIVMPVGEQADQDDVDTEDFSARISNAVYEAFRVSLDLGKNNFLEYKGSLLMCDFGDTNSTATELW
jgi:hypothetical protein